MSIYRKLRKSAAFAPAACSIIATAAAVKWTSGVSWFWTLLIKWDGLFTLFPRFARFKCSPCFCAGVRFWVSDMSQLPSCSKHKELNSKPPRKTHNKPRKTTLLLSLTSSVLLQRRYERKVEAQEVKSTKVPTNKIVMQLPCWRNKNMEDQRRHKPNPSLPPPHKQKEKKVACLVMFFFLFRFLS